MLWLVLLGIVVVTLFSSYGYNTWATHKAQAEFPPIGQFVDIEGTRLHYVCQGSGQAIVMLHGNAGFLQDYTRSLDQFAPQYRVYAFDRPGHGYSERPRALATFTDQVQLLHNALQTLGIEKPILVGHSWGCAIALAYALNYPKAISRIVLLAPLIYKFKGVPLLPASIAQAPALETFLKLIPTVLLSRWFVKQLLLSAFSPASIPNDYLRAAQQLWTRPSQLKATFQDSTTLQPAINAMSQCYPEIRVPIVIVTGDSDQFVNSEQNAYHLYQEISSKNSQSDVHVRLIVLPNTGHAIPQTQPKAVVNAVQLCC